MSDGGRVQFDDLELGNNGVMMSQGRPFTGVAYETNSSGKAIGEASFLDGIQRGVAREWLESGQLVSEAHYDFGVTNSPAVDQLCRAAASQPAESRPQQFDDFSPAASLRGPQNSDPNGDSAPAFTAPCRPC